jgi:uncharacterized paraquat-inducible protein A
MNYIDKYDGMSDEQKEKVQRIEQEFRNREAQGLTCGACKFFKPSASNSNCGRCLSSLNGQKNPSKIFENCGGGRKVYPHEVHTCYRC